MNKLTDIMTAIDALSTKQKRELFLFLATRLHTDASPLPAPRKFSLEQMQAWIADDEEGMRRLLAGDADHEKRPRRTYTTGRNQQIR
jgi:hypothetical protein